MTPDETTASNQNLLSGSEPIEEQVAQLIRLVRSGEEANIKLALLIAKSQGNPPAFQ